MGASNIQTTVPHEAALQHRKDSPTIEDIDGPGIGNIAAGATIEEFETPHDASREKDLTVRHKQTTDASIMSIKGSAGARSKPGFLRRLFSSSSSNQYGASDEKKQGSKVERVEVNPDSLRHKASVLFRRPATTGSIINRPQVKQDLVENGHQGSMRESRLPGHEPASIISNTNTRSSEDQSRPLFLQSQMPQGQSKMRADSLVADPTCIRQSNDEKSRIASYGTTSTSIIASSGEIPRATSSIAIKNVSDVRSSRESESETLEAPILPLVRDHSSPLGSLDLSQQISSDIHALGTTTEGKSAPMVRARSISISSALQDSPILGTLGDLDLPTEYLVRASIMYEWQDTSIAPEDYAMFLGKEELYNEGVREAYLNLFDFTGMSILKALRLFCSKLFIKGETQVLDRLIEGFSRRWRVCNITDKYLTQDVTYIIAFSLITLNTDMYVANLEKDQRMRRLAFIQNTMRAIRTGSRSYSYESDIPAWQSPKLGSPTAELTQEQTIRFVPRSSSSHSVEAIPPAIKRNHSEELVTAQTVLEQSPSETSFIPPSLSRKLSRKSGTSLTDEKGVALAFQSRDVYFREILSDMYLSIKSEQLRQPQSGGTSRLSNAGRSVSSARSSLRDGHYNSTADSRYIGSSGNASISSSASAAERSPGVTSPSTFLGRSSTNIYTTQQESRLSIIARSSQPPNPSATNHNAILQRGIGFAGSLNNVIIREEQMSPVQDQDGIARVVEEAEEDKLTLHGAPFAKEGRVKLKIIESVATRRSKYKNWSAELFAVLERGQVRLFDFSLKAIKNTQTTFGGGDWTQNARPVLDIGLAQTIASAIPVKSISRDRPYVWALTMASGDEHLFEVGTAELIEEWVSTANYWAARTTKEPLLGAVGNADYGWGHCLENNLSAENILTKRESLSGGTGARLRSSISGQSSDRTSISGLSPSNHADTRSPEWTARYPGNKADIRDWQPDPPPTIVSHLSQEAQLVALEKFIRKLELEIETHNSKKPLILQAFSPRHPNQIRALANFVRRRDYLASELRRYELYISALHHGIETARVIQDELDEKGLKDLQGA